MSSGPVIIGVAGGSGSGKTTVVRRIVESLGNDQVTVLEHDRYYRDRSDLRLEERAALNYDHPDSLETDLMVRHLQALRRGEPVEVPVYDFARYARTAATETAQPRRAIIVEGILIFTDAALRRCSTSRSSSTRTTTSGSSGACGGTSPSAAGRWSRSSSSTRTP